MREVLIELAEDEYILFKRYSEYRGVSLEELFKESLVEQIEDEYDSEVIRDYEDRCIAGEVSYIDFEDVNI